MAWECVIRNITLKYMASGFFWCKHVQTCANSQGTICKMLREARLLSGHPWFVLAFDWVWQRACSNLLGRRDLWGASGSQGGGHHGAICSWFCSLGRATQTKPSIGACMGFCSCSSRLEKRIFPPTQPLHPNVFEGAAGTVSTRLVPNEYAGSHLQARRQPAQNSQAPGWWVWWWLDCIFEWSIGLAQLQGWLLPNHAQHELSCSWSSSWRWLRYLECTHFVWRASHWANSEEIFSHDWLETGVLLGHFVGCFYDPISL